MKSKFIVLVANTLIVIVMLIHSAGILRLPALDRLENFFYDLRINFTQPNSIDNRVVIVDIDERSLRAEGHWPWARDKIAHLTDQLFNRYKIAALGFDVVFAEKDENREIKTLRQLAHERGKPEFIAELDELAAGLDRDKRLAASLTDRPVTLGYYFNTNPARTESAGQLPESLGFGESVKQSLYPPKGSSYGANIPVLQSAAMAGGFFSNPLIDNDGVVRRVPTIHEYDGLFYESLAVAVARSYLGMEIEPAFAETDPDSRYPNLEGIFIGPFYVPIDVNGGVLVPYRGRSGSFQYVSATDVLRGEVLEAEVLQDAIVLVGTTSLGLVDIRATPMQATFPGVEIHANVIAGVIDESFKHKPAWAWGAEFAILAAIGVLMIFLSPFLGPVRLWFFAMFILLLIVGFNIYLWNEKNFLMPLANSVLLIVALYIIDVMFGFFTEATQKRHVRNAFSHYLAPALVDQLTENPASLRLAGETKELTFLFSDIADFTTFAEQTDPEIVVEVLNEYLDEMCRITLSHGGTIDKFVGDAVIAMFNAPLEQADHACRAVACAVEMNLFCGSFSQRKRAAGLNIGITRIGVHTGVVIVGNFGGKERFDYTALGDTVNTASRLENVNKHLGTTVCVSGSTVAACPAQRFRSIGGLVLKGKTEITQAYEPLDDQAWDSIYLEKYNEAYTFLETQDPRAKELFSALHRSHPDDPLVNLHYGRIINGEISAVITMQEK